MSMFRSIRFLYAIVIMVMIYLRINLKLELLFFPTSDTSNSIHAVESDVPASGGGCRLRATAGEREPGVQGIERHLAGDLRAGTVHQGP
jgi:hypothetical protein